jgi:hypothetical protein
MSDSARTATAVLGPLAPMRRRRERWPVVLAAVAFVQYVLIGIWLISAKSFAIFDATSRTISAQVMVISRDPHLGAMGFYWFPLPMFIRVPFVLVLAPFGWSRYAGPIASAMCAALVIVVLAAIGRELKLSTAVTATFVGIYAFNPVTVFSAANGMSESTYALFIALTLLGLIRFMRTKAPRDIALIGLALAGGMASRVEFIPIVVAVTLACTIQVPRERMRITAVLVALPAAFTFALWTLASSLIQNDALFWYRVGRIEAATPEPHPWMPAELTATSILGYMGEMIVIVAPALFLIAVVGVLTRVRWRATIGLFMAMGSIPAFLTLQLFTGTTYGTPRYFAMLPLLVCIGAMWVVSTWSDRPAGRRVALTGAFAVLAVIGAVVATYTYTDPVRTQVERESVFFASIVGRPLPEWQRYFDDLGELIDDLDPALADGAFVAMDTRGGAAVLLSRHPRQFIVPEDRDFQEIMSDPAGRFDYVIKATVGLSSPFGATIDAAMATASTASGGSFQMVGDYGAAQLFRFERTD